MLCFRMCAPEEVEQTQRRSASVQTPVLPPTVEQRPAISDDVAGPDKECEGARACGTIVLEEVACNAQHAASAVRSRRAEDVRPALTSEVVSMAGSSVMHLAQPLPFEGEDDEDEAQTPPDPTEGWAPARRFVYRLLAGDIPKKDWNLFDTVMGAIIVFNVLVMIIETDQGADCDAEMAEDCVEPWIGISNMCLLIIYTVESAMRIYVERRNFYTSRWNLLDITIVFCGWVGVVLQDVEELRRVSILRLLRVARVIRVAKFLKRAPTLMQMIGGFVGAMQAMFWGLILILVLIVAWSLLAVELVYPESKKLDLSEDDMCKYAFSTVMRSTLTFFQTLVAGDSWGACSLGIIHVAPHLFLLFALSLVTVQLGFTNLVLAVIVDKANEARDLSKEEAALKKQREESKSVRAWRQVMKSMDEDGNGTLSAQELMEGYMKKPSVRSMLDAMHVRRKDLSELFRLMDMDNSKDLVRVQRVGVVVS